jgi:hypothetical protein
MVRALGLEPRTNALKGVFYGLHQVATACKIRCKSDVYRDTSALKRKIRAMDNKGYRKKVSQKYHFEVYGIYAGTGASGSGRSVECRQNQKR